MTRAANRAYTRHVNNVVPRTRGSGLSADLAALRRYFWLPVATLTLALTAALILSAMQAPREEARFRANVLVDALPPLFGPAVLPSPFDYARLATSDSVLADVSGQTGRPADQLRSQLRAEPRFNTPEIDFVAEGSGALLLSRAWQRSFEAAVSTQTADIERLLVQPYARQLDESRALLEQRAADYRANAGDPVLQQQLIAAQENFATASKLSQSYDVVARTMSASVLTVIGPHERSAGVSSTAGRLAVATAIGVVAGVTGALALDYLAKARRRGVEGNPIDAHPAFRGRRSRA